MLLYTDLLSRYSTNNPSSKSNSGSHHFLCRKYSALSQDQLTIPWMLFLHNNDDIFVDPVNLKWLTKTYSIKKEIILLRNLMLKNVVLLTHPVKSSLQVSLHNDIFAFQAAAYESTGWWKKINNIVLNLRGQIRLIYLFSGVC